MPATSDRRHLFLDIETYCSVDLAKCGVAKYVESPDFEVLLVSYAVDGDPVRCIDLTAREAVIDQRTAQKAAEGAALIGLITDPGVVRVAHNCAFERAGLGRYLGRYLPPEEWEDTMILAAMNGLPMSLDDVGAVLGIQNEKLKEGAALVSYFCKPCKPTISNGGRTRNRREDAPEKWERFIAYNVRDVEAERDIYYRLNSFPITPFERRVFATDARINERGVLIDRELAEAAVAIDEAHGARAEAEMKSLTGLSNPNSIRQLKAWLEAMHVPVDTLSKATVSDLRASSPDPVVDRVLELRQQLGKTSTSKYSAMLSSACADGRVRGITQYYGAGRTGRWAGRRVQLQNLPQNHLDDIDLVRELVRQRDADTLSLCFDSIPDVLSQLIRTALVAKDGHTFLVADYSAIEARVIAYLAGEKWRQDVFREGGDIYCASASQMFHVPVVKHGENGHLRQKGKIAELALGYGGGIHALIAFGADKMGLSENEMTEIVTSWRAASPKIPKLWREVESAARAAILTPGKSQRTSCGVIYFRDSEALRCRLPSGRVISYWSPRITEDDQIAFRGQDQTTHRWWEITTWGGKLVENIVQAFARDCLATAMVRLEEAGFDICFHVHDEVIVEAPDGSRWEDVAEIMGRPIEWAPGLLLRADGYQTKFYMKD